MKISVVKGATSQILQLFIQDSSNTTGKGLTGLTSIAGSGLTCSYHRNTDNGPSIVSLVNMTRGTFTSSGWTEISSSIMPGFYQFCPPNAALAVGADSVVFRFSGGTNMVDLPVEVQLTRFNSDNTQDGGIAAFSEVTLHAGTHSNATIQGISNYANISNVTLHAGTHSNVTIQGVTRVNSSVTPANALYSAVTVRIDPVDYSGATVGAGNIAPGTYSGVSVSVRAGGMAASSFQASAVDAAALATDAGQEIADRVLARSIQGSADGGRDVTSALRALRNRVFMDSGSTGTVYQEDDATSAWTFSVSTVAAVAISQIDPGA